MANLKLLLEYKVFFELAFILSILNRQIDRISNSILWMKLQTLNIHMISHSLYCECVDLNINFMLYTDARLITYVLIFFMQRNQSSSYHIFNEIYDHTVSLEADFTPPLLRSSQKNGTINKLSSSLSIK